MEAEQAGVPEAAEAEQAEEPETAREMPEKQGPEPEMQAAEKAAEIWQPPAEDGDQAAEPEEIRHFAVSATRSVRPASDAATIPM